MDKKLEINVVSPDMNAQQFAVCLIVYYLDKAGICSLVDFASGLSKICEDHSKTTKEDKEAVKRLCENLLVSKKEFSSRLRLILDE